MNAPRIKKISLLATLSVATVAGCSTASLKSSNAGVGRADALDRIAQNNAEITSNSAALNGIRKTNRPSNIQVREGLFLGDTGYQASNGNPLPSRFETKDGIALSMAGTVNIQQVSQAIEEITGIRVEYGDLSTMPQFGAAGANGGEDDSGNGGTSADATSDFSQGDSGNAENAAFLHPTERTFRINHKGKLSSLLDNIASKMDVDWTYEAGRIRFVGPQTITYTLWTLPSQTEAQSSVGGGGGDSSIFGGSSPASVSSTMTTNYWETIDAGMSSIIPNGGASYTVSRTAGTIIVTGPQYIHNRVRAFVETENRRMSRQVAVKLDVIAFSRSRGDQKGTSLSGLIDQAGRGFNIDIVSPANEVSEGVALNAGIVSGPLSGIGNVITALSESGEVSVLTSSTVIASNNTPTPVNISDERAYLAGSTTTSDGSTSTTTLETGIVRSGMNAVVTPRIMTSGMVNLQYTLNLTELVEFEEFSTADGNSMVQLPNVTSRNFMQTVNIGNGESLVIGAFNQQSSQDRRQGPFNPEFWGLGGKSNYSMEDTKVLVVMTPVVIEGQNKPIRR